MAVNRWRGDAQGRAQVTRLTLETIAPGYVITVTCNRKDAIATATTNSLHDAYNAIAAAIGAAALLYAEFSEFGVVFETDSDDQNTAILLTGSGSGKPFTITAAASRSFVLTVETPTQGVSRLNEIQQVSLPGPPTGGTFTITFEGATTSALAYNVSAGSLQTALEGLGTIGSGNVTVTGSSPNWTVEFGGTFAALNVALLTGVGSSLTGGARVSLATLVEGRAVTNAIYRIVPLTLTGTSYLLGNYGTTDYQTGFTTGPFAMTATANVVRGVLLAVLPGSTTADIIVTKDGDEWLIEFAGRYAGNAANNIIGGQNVTVAVEQVASATGRNEQQSLSIDNGPTAGTFTLSFSGQTTSTIAYNADAAAIQAALIALSNIGGSDVTVTGSNPSFVIEFTGALALSDQPQITANYSSLTGSSVSAFVLQDSRAGVNEIQTFYITGDPSGGTFKLTFDGQTTANLAYNISAVDLVTALELLSTIGPGDVSVALSGGIYFVTFGGALAYTNVPQMTGDPALLTAASSSVTLANTVVPTGPAYFDNAENWSLNALPATGDTIFFAESTGRPCLYGLEQAAISPAAIYFEASYQGQIGLPYDTGDYIEYRPRFLKLGTAADGRTMLVFIGRGPGIASALIFLNTGTVKTIMYVEQAQQGQDDAPAVRWLGTHADNQIFADRGTLGIAIERDQVATVKTLTVGFKESQDGDATVAVGPGVTLETVKKVGGILRLDCAVTGGIVNDAGETTITGEGEIASLKIGGGSVAYRSTGMLGGTCEVGGDGELTFEGDMRPKVVENPIKVYGDESNVVDPYFVATTDSADAGEFVVDYVQTTRFSDGTLGRNHRIVRSAL